MPDRTHPDYEREFIKQLQLNDQEVVRLLTEKEPGMLKKINTFATRHNFIEQLNDLANRRNVFSMPVEKLEDLLVSICKRVTKK